MKSDAREFVKTHQRFFETFERTHDKPYLSKKLGVSYPTAAKLIREGIDYGVIEPNTFKEKLGNFVGIYINGENIEFAIFDSLLNPLDFQSIKRQEDSSIEVQISQILTKLNLQYSFLYAAIAVNNIVFNGGEKIKFEKESRNMFIFPDLLTINNCIFVSSPLVKLIHIRDFLENKSNLVYYDLKLNLFSAIDENRLKERINDEYYGVLPKYAEELNPLSELTDKEKYIEYYESTKTHLYQLISPNIRSLISILRPEVLYLSCNIIKTKYLDFQAYFDISQMCFSNNLGQYNIPIKLTELNSKDIIKSTAKYAKYKFFDWQLHW